MCALTTPYEVVLKHAEMIPDQTALTFGIVIPEPRRDKQHRDAWALWRRRHQYDAQQARQRWHAYADEVPR